MAKITVIVPVYLTEEYLPRCLDSILNQSFSDFELILVEDGSPDNCGKICDKYAEKDGRIKVIHQSNAGVSSARNRGLDLASGDYIVFIDSDDWVGPHYLLDLMDSDADLVCHSFSTLDEKEVFIKRQSNHKRTLLISKDSILSLLTDGILGYTFAKRFSRRIIQENKIHFIEEINHTEDTLFTVDYLLHSQTAETEDKDNYFYVRYDTRITLSNQITLERLAMACTANSILCRKLLPQQNPLYEKLYYSRIGYNYISYIDKNSFSQFRNSLWKYTYCRSLLKNTDTARIIEHAPDALWKLSAHEKIIRALIHKNKYQLFFACLYDTVSVVLKTIKP